MSKVQVSTDSLKNLKEFLEFEAIHKDEIQITWIGQAGFVFKFKGKILVIDPYLSDYLSKKYRGKLFPHIRLMELPINPQLITNIDYILCSHSHADHMDPETITILSENNSNVKIIVPAAELEESINRGVKYHQILQINDGELVPLESEISVTGVAAAHETLKLNEKGQHHFLGFIFDFGGVRIYHSGDCIPYPGLTKRLKKLDIDVAL
ncbi:MAG: MBL fold metallo-hydrolase, partial [Promethearchaeota archaeon]